MNGLRRFLNWVLGTRPRTVKAAGNVKYVVISDPKTGPTLVMACNSCHGLRVTCAFHDHTHVDRLLFEVEHSHQFDHERKADA